MKIYVTKFWQTKGIVQVEARLYDDHPNMASYRPHNAYDQYVYGNDWHKTVEAARVDFESRRIKKIKSLQAKIIKLNSMKFEVLVK